jgi:hypothetical protein
MRRRVAYQLAAALLIFAMSFSYNNGANPPIDFPRLLCSDTQQTDANGNRIYIFEDQEYTAFTAMVSGIWQSSMFWSPPSGQATLPTSPVNYLRIAALALDSLAANKSRLASIKQLLDVKLDSSDAAIQLRATAAEYRKVDDESGAFVIIEQVTTDWSFRDRFWAQWQRTASV